ncbi:integrase catalytic domain-containing protein [Trichonephila clavipes]|nr:integrase catalytic domain-containing protein [Trichonephila clavipes]
MEMGLVIPSKAEIIDLKKLIESSAMYKNDIEFVHSLVENALEKKKAFQIKSVPDELKAEILLNILGQRVNNLLTYVRQEDLRNYVKIKELILREFEPTPQECLGNFKKARKLPSENNVQFASRLSATFDYYCVSCVKPNNSLIHFSCDKTRNPTSNLNLDAPTFVPGQIERSVEANSQSQFVVTGFEKGRLKNVFLSTVRALVKNKSSQWVEVRCLLDVGSQSCLCTRACAEKLQLKMEKINTVVLCVNNASMVVKNCVKTSVANKAKTFESELMLLVVNKITDLIPNKVIDVDVNVSEFVP